MGHLKEHESPGLVPPSGKLMSFPTPSRHGTENVHLLLPLSPEPNVFGRY